MNSNTINTYTILAVDDEEIIGYLIQRVVDLLGYQVEWVTNCETALQKIHEKDYDVIISDFKFPQMNGDVFYMELAKKKRNLTKRLIFLTGDILNNQTIQFLESFQIPYLSKPFSIDKLKEMIESVLSNQTK
jgi:DNA-binding response OmpR family regulator